MDGNPTLEDLTELPVIGDAYFWEDGRQHTIRRTDNEWAIYAGGTPLGGIRERDVLWLWISNDSRERESFDTWKKAVLRAIGYRG